MNKLKFTFLVLLSMGIGIMIGGYLFSQSQPRSFLSIKHCRDCLSHADLLGLIASVGIQRFPGFIPSVAFETDKTVAIKLPSNNLHYVIIPKKDIKNIGEVSEGTGEYLLAVQEFKSVLAKDSSNADAYRELGETYQMTKDTKKLRWMKLFSILIIFWGEIPPWLKG